MASPAAIHWQHKCPLRGKCLLAPRTLGGIFELLPGPPDRIRNRGAGGVRVPAGAAGGEKEVFSTALEDLSKAELPKDFSENETGKMEDENDDR